jgi:hypothetical protein
MLRKGSAGSNTAADHIAIVDASVAALPPAWRRNLMVTVDGAGFSHKLVEHLDALARRRGYTLVYSCGRELDAREKAAIRLVPGQAWQIAVDHRGEVRERRAEDACADAGCGQRACWIEEAHVTELTGLLREGPGGDQLTGWPGSMRIFARRERPHPGAKLSLSGHEDGYRYQLWATNLPATTRGWRGQNAYIDAGRRVHARVEDSIRTGKATGISRFPSHDYTFNQAWLTAAMMAQILLAWLKLLALDGDLAKAEPKTLRYRVLHAARWCTADAAAAGNSPPAGPGPKPSPGPGNGYAHCRTPADQHGPVPATRENPGACGNPAPGPPAGPPSYPDPKISAVAAILGNSAAASDPRE